MEKKKEKKKKKKEEAKDEIFPLEQVREAGVQSMDYEPRH